LPLLQLNRRWNVTRSPTYALSCPVFRHHVRQIAHDMRERWMETALSEFGDSGYEGVDFQSFNVWANHNWWIVPWWDQVGKYRPNGSSDSDGTTSNTT